MPFDLQLTLLRHGRTSANERHLYAGSTDVALSDAGISDARRSGICDSCGLVYVSPLVRARQTARICFPNARQVVCDGLREMDFGAFEGRSADDMADDADYRRWVDSNCTLPCPGGESRALLICRVSRSVEDIVVSSAAQGSQSAVIVAHGGTIMAALEAFVPRGAQDDEFRYFSWQVGNCGGYRVRARLGQDGLVFARPERFDALRDIL